MEMGIEFESFVGAGIVGILQNYMHRLAALGWLSGQQAHISGACSGNGNEREIHCGVSCDKEK